MDFISYYLSPIGKIILASDGKYLTKLVFDDSKDSSKINLDNREIKELDIFDLTKRWLDDYFLGKEVINIDIPIKLDNMSKFSNDVLDVVNDIPYGKTITYGEIANIIANKYHIKKMSAQAIGHVVGSNPICLIIPCHRVVASNSIGGYGGGLDRKRYLLKLEKVPGYYES